MNLRTPFYILGVVMLSTLVSCLGSNDDSDAIYSPDAEIISFSIKNDSIALGLDTFKFSIDQVNSLIYNRDSAYYGLKLTEKVIVTYSTVSGFSLLNITDGDSVWVASGDSINLANPLILRSYASDEGAKDYLVKFNIHQIDPDAIWWKQVNSDLDFLTVNETKTILSGNTFYCFSKYVIPPTSGYSGMIKLNTSTDNAVNWTDEGSVNLPMDADLSQIQLYGDSLFVCTSSGDLYTAGVNDVMSWTIKSSDYPVKNVLGVIAKKNLLVLAVEKDGILYSVVYDGNTISEPVPGNEIPSGFPIQAFSSVSYERTNFGRLIVAGGADALSWGTDNGSYWSKLGNLLPLNVQKANVFMYDGKFYLLNGISDNLYNKSVYTSIDGTITWQLSPSKTYLPDEYTFRTGASVVVGSDNAIYIIGGRNEDNPVADIWKGRLNKLN